MESENEEVGFDAMAFNGIADRYEVIPLQVRQVKDINNSNVIAGAADSNNSVGCIWSNGNVTIILPTGETYSLANSINILNQVVGHIIPVSTYKSKSFLYENGIFTYLPELGTSSSALCINNNSEIVGKYINAKGYNRGYYYNKGIIADIGTLGGSTTVVSSINNKSQIVGYSTISDSSYNNNAFVYGGGLFKNLGTLGGPSSEATDINENGWIIGNSDTGLFYSKHAFVYTNGKMYDLGTLNGKNSYAFSINNLNIIVGMSEKITQVIQSGSGTSSITPYPGTGSTSAGTGSTIVYNNTDWNAFIWSNGYMIDLNDRIDKKSGWRITQANAINDNGWIVGLGKSSDNSTKALLLKPIFNL